MGPTAATMPNGLDLHAVRRLVVAGRAGLPAGAAVASVHDLTTPDSGVRVRVYEPVDATPGLPPVVYLHGGGWVLCDIEDFDPLCRALAAGAGATVVSVGYRLAPEHPFPAPLDDAWEAVRWAAGSVSGTGELVLMGDSAGGNLAAVCARRARDAGGPAVVAQVLAYPMLDHRLDRPSHVAHADVAALTTADVGWYWDRYLPDPAARDDPDAAPLLAPDLAGLPPAYLLLASDDPLVDEGLAYAEALRAAGVDATAVGQPGTTHGFLSRVGTPEAAAGLRRVLDHLATLTP